jgi:hypothetical protein
MQLPRGGAIDWQLPYPTPRELGHKPAHGVAFRSISRFSHPLATNRVDGDAGLHGVRAWILERAESHGPLRIVPAELPPTGGGDPAELPRRCG